MAKKKQLSSTSLTNIRETAVSAMSDALREVFVEIESCMADLKSKNLREYYHLGSLVHKIATREEEFSTLNARKPEDLVSDAMSKDQRTLRFAKQFYQSYAAEQFNAVLLKKNPGTNYSITSAHIKYLLTVEDPAKRTGYEDTCINESMTPKDLHDFIKRKEGRASGHGPGHGVPKSVLGQLSQILSIATTFADKQESVWNSAECSFFENARTLIPELLTQDHILVLADIAVVMRQVAEYATANITIAESIAEELRIKLTAVEAAAVAEVAAVSEQVVSRTRRSRAVRSVEQAEEPTAA